ncbi:SDR family NAD(P)-dependent oxidoreductase [Fodinicola acaciae]|uniref:SDR family NAD(P)-dependent oxidoreductase n=1 Tax=Fodinicola acaciae TaxID=2681555 RepID=UPI0013D30641|nr:SDR family NAD(P)-dependent oxidoreductase [Fodinicola acaciae]
MRIENAVALVTGASSGLGEATARALAEAGARVVLLDRDADSGQAVADSIDGKFVHVDITDRTEVAEAVNAAADLGPLRVAVNCAGVGDGCRVVDRKGRPHDLALFERIVAINLTGSFNVLRLAAAAMASLAATEDGERGIVVNTASIAGLEGQTGQAAYAASKGGIVGLTLAAARDLGPHGVRVVTIAPGIFGTAMVGLLPLATRADLLENLAFPPRTGHPEEFADLVLSAVRNPYLNGETIRLDGGLRMTNR